MNASARTKIERAVLALLVAELAKAGFSIAGITGDEFERVTSAKKLTEKVFDLDDCRIYFAKSKRSRSDLFGVRLVRGNNGDDLLSDWHVDDKAFSAVLDRVMKLIDSAPLRFVTK